jgi:rSAM/selenodomain-associated transferase 2
MEISIIVPALNEEQAIGPTLASARAPGVREIIVVDGDSADSTAEVARRFADHLLIGPRGRALQMNAGAAVASGEALLFLHADTILPGNFVSAVRGAFDDPGVVGGRFDVRLEPRSLLLWLTGTLINARSRLSRISTGDQAIFVRRDVFEALGGYPPIPLMEDVAFSRALKRKGKVVALREQVVTSSRRWRHDGVIRTILLMWSLRFLYFCGVSPERLRRAYADTRESDE